MPTEPQLLRDLYRHNAKSRRCYLRKIWNLPVRERYRDRGATSPSLVDIYLHILDDHRFWFIEGCRGGSFQDYPIEIQMSRARAERATREEERLTEDVLKGLRARDLERKIRHPADRKSLPMRSMLLNLLQGKPQHQGELNAALWQRDTETPWLGYA